MLVLMVSSMWSDFVIVCSQLQNLSYLIRFALAVFATTEKCFSSVRYLTASWSVRYSWRNFWWILLTCLVREILSAVQCTFFNRSDSWLILGAMEHLLERES